jgi:hypothetical protein
MSFPNPFNGDASGNSKLPPLKDIPIGGITVDDYIEWRRKLLHNVSQVPKYNTILTDEPTDSWNQFRDTYDNLPPNILEKAYLDSHQVLSAYIHGSIPNAIEIMIQRKMKENLSTYHLPTLLGLSTKGDFNAYGLLKLLDAHYIAKSNYRLQQVLTKLQDLKYNGHEDPKIFISQYKELHNQGRLLVPCWPTYHDQYLAHDILLRLPSQLDTVKISIMDRGLDHPKDVHEVEEALDAWWIRKMNKMATPSSSSTYNSNSTPNGNTSGHRPYRGKSYTHSQTGNTLTGTVNVNHSHGPTPQSIFDKRKPKYVHQEDQDIPETTLSIVYATAIDNEHKESAYDVGVVSSATADEYLPGSNDILFDTGAAVSVTGQKHLLVDQQETDKMRVTGFTGGHGVISSQHGTLRLSAKVKVNQVRYVPSCTYSLLSVGQVTKNGYHVIFTNEGAYTVPSKFLTANDVERMKKSSILTADKVGSLYVREISKRTAIERQLDDKNQFVYDAKAKSGKIPKKSDRNNNPTSSSSSSQPSSAVNMNVSTVNTIPSPPISNDNHHDDDGDY